MGIDALEDECIHRAMDGSDTLLMFMLRARRPDKFRDRRSWEVHSNYGDDFRRIPMDELCVERSFAWLRSYRRLNTIVERSKEHLIAFVEIAFISILSRRLKRLVVEEIRARRKINDPCQRKNSQPPTRNRQRARFGYSPAGTQRLTSRNRH
jgi:hypothetical protein